MPHLTKPFLLCTMFVLNKPDSHHSLADYLSCVCATLNLLGFYSTLYNAYGHECVKGANRFDPIVLVFTQIVLGGSVRESNMTGNFI